MRGVTFSNHSSIILIALRAPLSNGGINKAHKLDCTLARKIRANGFIFKQHNRSQLGICTAFSEGSFSRPPAVTLQGRNVPLDSTNEKLLTLFNAVSVYGYSFEKYDQK